MVVKCVEIVIVRHIFTKGGKVMKCVAYMRVSTEKQAEDFFKIYKQELTNEQKRLVYDFANLSRYSFIKRKRLILKRKYLKSGLVRNLGVLLLG